MEECASEFSTKAFPGGGGEGEYPLANVHRQLLFGADVRGG